MVDVHYIKRGNKSYGPYYYRSYRVGNKVKKEYLGKDYPKSIHKNKNKRKIISFFVLLFLAAIVIPLVMFFGGITGKTTLGANTTLQSNESLQTSGDNLTKEIINSVSLASPQANLSDITNVSVDETSQGDNQSGLAQTNAAEQPTEFNSMGVSEIIVQHKAVIGKPVKWTKRVILETPSSVSVELPKEASNIAVKKILNEAEESIPINSAGITGNIALEINLTGIQKKQTGMLGRLREVITGKVVKETGNGQSWIVNEIRQIFRAIRVTITGHAVEETSGAETEKDKFVEIKEAIKEVEIEYETPAPTADEIRLTQYSKRIIISSETHYTDILSYTSLPAEVQSKAAIRLYQLAGGNKQEVEFTAYDTNNNNMIDYIEWVVPSLSSQTYELSITVLNPYAYLRDNENWTVEFSTMGQADLIITSTNAKWQEIKKDLPSFDEMKFLEIKCGDASLENKLKIIDGSGAVYNYNSLTERDSVKPVKFLIENYSCDNTSYFKNNMLKAGYAVLKFDFGGQIAYAYDPSAPTITSIQIKPATANQTDALNCSATYNDADGDKGNVTFYWYNGSALFWQATQYNKMNGEQINEPLTWVDKNGLVGYWKFSDGNGTQVRDISGNENNGTLTNFNFNGNSGWSDGKYGKALLFDGSNDYVSVNDNNLLDLTTSGTIGFWIYPKGNNTSGWQFLLSKDGTSDERQPYSIQYPPHTNERIALYLGNNVASQSLTSNTPIRLNTWYHVVFTWNSSNKTVYINGDYDNRNAFNSGIIPFNSNTVLAIGMPPSRTTYPFNGTLDEVMIFNRSLTSGEISEIYNNSPYARGETWNCTINTTDSGGDAGLPNSTTRTISNAIPDVPEIGGPENATRTIGNSQTLRCANSTDTDGDTINYVFYMDTNTPSTTMRQNSTATTYTFSTNDGWTYYWRCKAEDGAGGVSAFTAQKTFTENTQPTAVNMVYPTDGNSITNRTPQLNWSASTDAEGDSITYQINATCYPSCSADNRLPNSSINENWITITSRLKNFWDDNYYYNWTVRPWDGYEFGTWNSVPYTLKLSSLISLSMINSSVNFSVLSMGDTANTTANNPVPLSIRNDGNSFVSVNMSNETSLLWTSQPTASEYFRYRIDNVTGEENSFNWTLSTTAWTNVPTSNNTVINYLNYTDATDSAEIEILVTVPPQEQAGTKSSRLVFTGFYVREI